MEEASLAAIRHALSVARKGGYSEVEAVFDGASFEGRLEPRRPLQSSNGGLTFLQEPAIAESPQQSAPQIVATLVGYYREAQTPLRPGDRINKGDVVAVISALGLANDVEAQHSGEVEEVLVKPGQAVEYGQPLARLRVPE
jgi:acetyl-CoA carboxylase biotin carboxyl carrier protein